MNKNTLEAIQALVSQSIPFICLEVRGTNADYIEYISQKDGKKASFSWLALACETLGDQAQQIAVSTDLPKGVTVTKLGEGRDAPKQVAMADGSAFVPPYKKGQKILVVIGDFERDKGVTKIKAKSIQVIE